MLIMVPLHSAKLPALSHDDFDVEKCSHDDVYIYD